MLLELREVSKRFGGIRALTSASLCVDRGQVHLLLGENGAGKSTLMKIVAGMHERDSGAMVWEGVEVHFRRPPDASASGIAMVHQESLLAPHLSVAENIFLGREPSLAGGFVQRRRMIELAARLIERHSFPLQPDWQVGRLSPAGKQLVEICRAIQSGSSLLIFDEPTSALSDVESQEVFRTVSALRERNMAVIYITHRFEELRTIGGNVTILRDGATVHTGPLDAVTNEEIIRHMVGREVTTIYERQPGELGEELLRVEALNAPPLLRGIHLSVRAGEIVGLAGLIGAGRTELCGALFGVLPLQSGRIVVAGRQLRKHTPRDAVRAGLALIPEDRQGNGLATRLPAGQNIALASLESVSRFGGAIDASAEKRVVTEYFRRLRIKAESPGQLAGRLSGGNQQKVVIARWVARGARVFLFDEPTRGIDVGAKAEVFELMDELARQGAAILMVSSELEEVIPVADRILVMRAGRVAGELPRGAPREEVLRLATMQTEANA